jgi:hypothetical protein
MKNYTEDHEFVKLEKAVEEVLVENNLQAVLYFSKIHKHWEIIVGKPLAQKTFPVQLQSKKLVVMVEDAAYSHHLKYFERQILDLIASPEICGEGVVKSVEFRVGKQSKHQGLQPKQTEPAEVEGKITEIKQEALDTAESIADRKLKASFVRLMSRRFFKKSNIT